jgi:hypothetical protein
MPAICAWCSGQPHAGKRKQKRQHANRQAGAQIGAQRNRINFRARQERQHAAAQHRQEIRPVGRLQDMLAAGEVKVAREDAEQDFDERHGNADANGNQAGRERQPHPDGGHKPNVLMHKKLPPMRFGRSHQR